MKLVIIFAVGVSFQKFVDPWTRQRYLFFIRLILIIVSLKFSEHLALKCACHWKCIVFSRQCDYSNRQWQFGCKLLSASDLDYLSTIWQTVKCPLIYCTNSSKKRKHNFIRENVTNQREFKLYSEASFGHKPYGLFWISTLFLAHKNTYPTDRTTLRKTS